jgi:hypothetical protein
MDEGVKLTGRGDNLEGLKLLNPLLCWWIGDEKSDG